MNKKSQFYMFATMILLGLVFAVISNKSSIRTGKISNTQNLIKNYKHEAIVVMNNAIYHNKNISEELRNFTGYFISYADQRNIDIGMAYLYTYDNQLFIGNHLKENILVGDTGATLKPDQEYVTGFDNDLTLEITNNSYRFTFSADKEVELRSLVIQNE